MNYAKPSLLPSELSQGEDMLAVMTTHEDATTPLMAMGTLIRGARQNKGLTQA